MEIKVLNVRVQIDGNAGIDLTPAHQAMAKRYKEIVLSTFGQFGVNRASEWAALSKSYKAELRRRGDPILVPTLYRTGAIYRSIEASADAKAGHVVCENELGAYHQFGMGRNKLRPFFPALPNGSPTQFAQAEIEKAAAKALK